MIVWFYTWERASVFVTEMQSEGRHAVILDEGTCFMWGPLTTGGIRVAVSDIVLDEDGEWPEMETRESEFANVLSGLVGLFAVSGPLLLLAVLAIDRARDAGRDPRDSVEILVGLICVAVVAGAFAVMGPVMPAFTRFLRNDESLASWIVRLLVALPLIV